MGSAASGSRSSCGARATREGRAHRAPERRAGQPQCVRRPRDA